MSFNCPTFINYERILVKLFMQELVILHGAIGSAGQMEFLAKAFESRFNVHNINLPGHGGTSFPVNFSLPSFADAVQSYCDEKGLKKISVFGYSMGGYVAMLLAIKNPDLVQKVITLGTKFQWNETIAAKETGMMQPMVIKEKLPQFADTLEKRHAPADWKELLRLTALMLEEMGRDNPLKEGDYNKIATPSLILLGDRDKMVSFEETLMVYKSLSKASLGILPQTPHAIEQVNLPLLVFLVNQFLEE